MYGGTGACDGAKIIPASITWPEKPTASREALCEVGNVLHTASALVLRTDPSSFRTREAGEKSHMVVPRRSVVRSLGVTSR